MREKQFREDLYFRLNVVPVNIPSLRERREDILPLAGQFLHRTFNGNKITFDAETKRMLEVYDYPGNIRELKNIVEHAAIFCSDSVIRPSDLSFSKLGSLEADFKDVARGGAQELNLAESEKRLIEKALEKSSNHSAAARSLGITP